MRKLPKQSHAALVLSILAWLFTAGCSHGPGIGADEARSFGINPGAPIHFNVMKDYRGIIEIYRDTQKGVKFGQGTKKIVINVPDSGRVAIQDFGPFEQPHAETASYSDGVAIPINDQLRAAIPPDTTALFSVGTVRGGGYTNEVLLYFLGTKAEFDKFKL